MLRVAACLEEHFPHSMANAVAAAARAKGLDHQEMHTKVEYFVAHGIASRINRKTALIGSYHFIFEDEKVKVDPEDQARFHNLPDQYSLLYLAIGKVLSAVICILDPLRTEARETMEALWEASFTKTVMLPGDSARSSAAVTTQVGVDEFQAEVLPPATSALLHNGSTVLLSVNSMTPVLKEP